eukprot:9611329-Prorocentrum_lima.AAC.1
MSSLSDSSDRVPCQLPSDTQLAPQDIVGAQKEVNMSVGHHLSKLKEDTYRLPTMSSTDKFSNFRGQFRGT